VGPRPALVGAVQVSSEPKAPQLARSRRIEEHHGGSRSRSNPQQ